MRERMPEAFEQLVDTLDRLEAHYRDLQDIEFTVEEGTLYLLQTRTGKRTAAAALRVAAEMVDEGLISREEAVARIDPGPARPAPASDDRSRRADRGRRARAQRVTGRRVGRDRARRGHGRGARQGRARTSSSSAGRRPRTTSTASSTQRGVLTAHGGMTSHAAVVARGDGQAVRRRLVRGPLDRRRGGTVRIGEHELARATSSRSTAAPERDHRVRCRSSRLDRRELRPMPRRPASSAEGSASAGPSTCSWREDGSPLPRARDDPRARRGRAARRAREAAAHAAGATSRGSSRRWPGCP